MKMSYMFLGNVFIKFYANLIHTEYHFPHFPCNWMSFLSNTVRNQTSSCSLALLSLKYWKPSILSILLSLLPCMYLLTYQNLLDVYCSLTFSLSKNVDLHEVQGSSAILVLAFLGHISQNVDPCLTLKMCFLEWEFANLELFTTLPPPPFIALLLSISLISSERSPLFPSCC